TSAAPSTTCSRCATPAPSPSTSGSTSRARSGPSPPERVIGRSSALCARRRPQSGLELFFEGRGVGDEVLPRDRDDAPAHRRQRSSLHLVPHPVLSCGVPQVAVRLESDQKVGPGGIDAAVFAARKGHLVLK